MHTNKRIQITGTIPVSSKIELYATSPWSASYIDMRKELNRRSYKVINTHLARMQDFLYIFMYE